MAQAEIVQVEIETDRDEELRRAHRRAFGKILEARATSNYHATVTCAVQELVDACEAYIFRAV